MYFLLLALPGNYAPPTLLPLQYVFLLISPASSSSIPCPFWSIRHHPGSVVSSPGTPFLHHTFHPGLSVFPSLAPTFPAKSPHSPFLCFSSLIRHSRLPLFFIMVGSHSFCVITCTVFSIPQFPTCPCPPMHPSHKIPTLAHLQNPAAKSQEPYDPGLEEKNKKKKNQKHEERGFCHHLMSTEGYELPAAQSSGHSRGHDCFPRTLQCLFWTSS